MRISKITNIYRFWVLQVPTHWLHFCLDSTIHIFQQTHAHLPFLPILIYSSTLSSFQSYLPFTNGINLINETHTFYLQLFL